MKKILALMTSVLLLGCLNQAIAQETRKDTLDLEIFFSHLDKGDRLPYKYIYQKAKVGLDTTITCAVQKDFELEVVENNKEEYYVIFEITTSNFTKSGEECNQSDMYRTTCLVNDGFPVQLKVWYSGDGQILDYPDTLKERARKNMLMVADTLHKYNEEMTKEQLVEDLDYMTSDRYVIIQATSALDLSDMFSFSKLIYEPDSVYSDIDSIYSYIDKQYHSYENLVFWDDEFSRSVPDYSNFYVLRSITQVNDIAALTAMDIQLDEESPTLLKNEANRKRCVYGKEITLLADKAMGVPCLMEVTMVSGFYETIGDQHFKMEKVIISLDFDKMNQEEDEDEENEDEPRYDDYGFIKVK